MTNLEAALWQGARVGEAQVTSKPLGHLLYAEHAHVIAVNNGNKTSADLARRSSRGTFAHASHPYENLRIAADRVGLCCAVLGWDATCQTGSYTS